MYTFNHLICTTPTSISAYLWQNTWNRTKRHWKGVFKQNKTKNQYSFSRKIQYNQNFKHMLPSSVLRPKRQMCFNKSRQYEEKSFHFSLQIPVTAHLFHFPCLPCAVSVRQKTLSNQTPRIWCGLGNCNNSVLENSYRHSRDGHSFKSLNPLWLFASGKDLRAEQITQAGVKSLLPLWNWWTPQFVKGHKPLTARSTVSSAAYFSFTSRAPDCGWQRYQFALPHCPHYRTVLRDTPTLGVFQIHWDPEHKSDV